MSIIIHLGEIMNANCSFTLSDLNQNVAKIAMERHSISDQVVAVIKEQRRMSDQFNCS